MDKSVQFQREIKEQTNKQTNKQANKQTQRIIGSEKCKRHVIGKILFRKRKRCYTEWKIDNRHGKSSLVIYFTCDELCTIFLY